MSKVAKGYGAIFASVQKTVKTSSGSAINIVICLATVGSEQLFSFAVFNCPCPKDTNATSGVVFENSLYGWVFILVPAFALFVLGYGMNVKTWKLTTGCCKRHKQAARGYIAGCITIMEIFVQALVAPVAWSSVAFLDGNYYACATTAHPYRESCELVIAKTSNFKYSLEYKDQERQSKIIGWCLIAFSLFLGSIFYMIHRCMSSLTYHHRKYARWYTEIESKLFEEKAREQIEKELQNDTLERFFEKKRKKSTWDKISTVFTFTRDDSGYALYSRLDEWHELKWLKEQKNQQEDADDPTKALLEDSPCVDPLSGNNNDMKDPQEEAEMNSVTVDENIPKDSQEETKRNTVTFDPNIPPEYQEESKRNKTILQRSISCDFQQETESNLVNTNFRENPGDPHDRKQSSPTFDPKLIPLKNSKEVSIEMQKIPPPPLNKNAGRRKTSICSADESEDDRIDPLQTNGYGVTDRTNVRSKSANNLYDRDPSHTMKFLRTAGFFPFSKMETPGRDVNETAPLM